MVDTYFVYCIIAKVFFSFKMTKAPFRKLYGQGINRILP